MFIAQRIYAGAVLGVVVLSIRLSHACFVTNWIGCTADTLIPQKRAMTLVFWHQQWLMVSEKNVY